MKPEPLKNKRKKAQLCCNGNITEEYFKLYIEKDIKSAVEWYLQETKKPIFPKDNKLYDEWVRSKPKLNYKVWLVLKAFEDVMK